MAEVRITREVAAPLPAVFDGATDVSSWADVIKGISALEVLSDGPVGVGTRWRETRVMFGKAATEEMEITEFDRPDRYVVEARSHGAHYRTEFLFSAAGDRTRIDMTFTATPETTGAKVLSVLMKPMMRSMSRLMEADLDDLKAALETR